jgi:hypothetical protein
MPTGIGEPTTVLVAVLITETVLSPKVRDIDLAAVRGDRRSVITAPPVSLGGRALVASSKLPKALA